MENFINKIYKFERSDEHFEAYLAGIGLNFLNRKLAKSIPTSTQVVQISDNEYALKTILPFLTHQQNFVLGQETENTTVDGRKIRNVFTLDDNKLIERQIESKREVTLIREFTEKEMLGTSIVGAVKSSHWSKLIE